LVARAERFGTRCTDLYFTRLNVTGRWVSAPGGDHFSVEDRDGPVRPQGPEQGFYRYGPIKLKVAHAATREGIRYLNVYASDLAALAREGIEVGGLLGEDDHTFATKPDIACTSGISLWADTDDETQDQDTNAATSAVEAYLGSDVD